MLEVAKRRYTRWARRRAQRAAGAAAPLYRRAVVLPVLDTGPVPLSKLIAVASAGWKIEEDRQLSEQGAGLDAGQVIRWRSWHR
jgi:hypothetical protein